MKLYDSVTSPSPRRVRIFAAEKGIELTLVPVDLRNREQLEPHFLKLNPWATVPVLELDDGTCISEVSACQRYLEAAYPEPPLMGRSPKEQGVVAMWDHRIEWDGFLATAEVLRNTVEGMKHRGLAGPVNYAQIPALAERGKHRLEWFYKFMDERLGESEYVAGSDYTVADIDGLVVVDFATRAKVPPPDGAANLKRWYEKVSARPSAKA